VVPDVLTEVTAEVAPDAVSDVSSEAPFDATGTDVVYETVVGDAQDAAPEDGAVADGSASDGIVSQDVAAPDSGDAGVWPEAEDDGGCGCSTPGASPGSSVVTLLVALGAMLLRRRPRA